MRNYISPVDLTFGDISINFCDPTFLQGRRREANYSSSNLAQRISAYALFANRVIIPSRYLLQKSSTFQAVIRLSNLLEEGIIVPDIPKQYGSFQELARDNLERHPDLNPQEHINCAVLLDNYASCVFRFDSSCQGRIYKLRLLDDISSGGLLYQSHSSDNNFIEGLKRIEEEYYNNKSGGRSLFLRLARKHLPAYINELDEWAGLRYYTTPAEVEPYCLRDFPNRVSKLLREVGLSHPIRFVDPDENDKMPEPMASAYEVTQYLPESLSENDYSVLAEAVCFARENCTNASAKFARLSKKGFSDSIEEINNLFQEALDKEKERLSLASRDSLKRIIANELTSKVIYWALGFASGQAMMATADTLGMPDIESLASQISWPINEIVDLSVSVTIATLMERIHKKLRTSMTPFIETTSLLKIALNDRKINQ